MPVVYGLSGSSGTGKSHRAVALANELLIPAIIDDGLLISGNKIMAGRSAKAELSSMAAIRRAIFHDEEHAREVRQGLAKLAPPTLLVLGTSQAMVLRICRALQLPPPEVWLDISQVATPQEMQQAQQQRLEAGTHVIPVAPTEVRRLIPVALADVFDSMRRTPRSQERTLVRPTFGPGGASSAIPLAMIRPLIEQVVADYGGCYRILGASLGQRGEMELTLELAASFAGLDLQLLRQLQAGVLERVQRATGRTLGRINLKL
ncbi:MAG: hypothetical protein FWF06_07065 [Symbiobacteriaceae bacterium]|nr:hypothetical protein [Symbiobacteriaceae bacterium]